MSDDVEYTVQSNADVHSFRSNSLSASNYSKRKWCTSARHNCDGDKSARHLLGLNLHLANYNLKAGSIFMCKHRHLHSECTRHRHKIGLKIGLAAIQNRKCGCVKSGGNGSK